MEERRNFNEEVNAFPVGDRGGDISTTLLLSIPPGFAPLKRERKSVNAYGQAMKGVSRKKGPKGNKTHARTCEKRRKDAKCAVYLGEKWEDE